MSNTLGVPLLLLAALLQSTFIPQIRILGGTPDLVFLLVLAWSVHAPLESAVTWAFLGGIFQDLRSAAPTGTSALGMILIVFGVTQIQGQFYRVGFFLIVALVLVGTLVKQVVVMIVLSLSGFQIYPVENFAYVVVPTMAYNLVFIWPIYWLVRRIQRRMEGGSSRLT